MSKLPTTGRANANYKCIPNYNAKLIQCNILKFNCHNFSDLFDQFFLLRAHDFLKKGVISELN